MYLTEVISFINTKSKCSKNNYNVLFLQKYLYLILEINGINKSRASILRCNNGIFKRSVEAWFKSYKKKERKTQF